MLLKSSVLFWALVQLLISESQCTRNPGERRKDEIQNAERWTPWVQNACIKDGTKLGPTLYGATASGVECQQWCDNFTGCVSVDYRPHSADRECRLSSDGSHQPCDPRRVGTEFSERVQEPAIARICPRRWKSIDNKCFLGIKFNPEFPIRTWEEARSFCVNKGFPGADLASVQDPTSLNAYLKDIGAPGYWVGGYKFNTNQPFPPTRWLWINRNPIIFPGPSPAAEDKKCLYMTYVGGSSNFHANQCDAAGDAGYGLVCELY